MVCKICNKEFKNAVHISKAHNITSHEYYDTYIKIKSEGLCKICGKPTKFLGLKDGYNTYCSVKCHTTDPIQIQKRKDSFKKTCLLKYGVDNPQKVNEIQQKTKLTNLKKYGTEYAIGSKIVKDKIIANNQIKYGVDWPLQSKEIQNKIIQSCIDHYGVSNPMYTKEISTKAGNTRKQRQVNISNTLNLLFASDIVKEYGQGWWHNRYILGLNLININNKIYMTREDVEKVKEYSINHFDGHRSFFEYNFIQFVKSIYNDQILSNKRTIITPFELDMYLPKINLAIETNGNWFHSIEAGCTKEYHLKKSLLCRNKGIRLIHVYGFEDIDNQKQLLKDLINGIDNYPKNDFNKNNLIEYIPQPEIIYQDKFTVYGAGKLY